MSVFVGEENGCGGAIPFCDDPDAPAGVVGWFVSGKDTVITGADSFIILKLITVAEAPQSQALWRAMQVRTNSANWLSRVISA